VDVRIIAATHQNLENRVNDGLFREDLFHRLNVIRIHIPPLRERQEDIPALARHFLNTAAKSLGMETKTLDKETENYIASLPWQGNVRQLENVCHWLTVMSPGQEIHIDDLPPEMKESHSTTSGTDMKWQESLRHWAERQLANGESGILDSATPEFERIMIETAMQKSGGRRQDAAALLGWGRNTLTRKIKELGLEETV